MENEAIHLVRVTTDDVSRQLWAAATSRDRAIDHVLNSVPEGWTASLLDESLNSGQEAVSHMARGEVRKLKDSDC